MQRKESENASEGRGGFQEKETPAEKGIKPRVVKTHLSRNKDGSRAARAKKTRRDNRGIMAFYLTKKKRRRGVARPQKEDGSGSELTGIGVSGKGESKRIKKICAARGQGKKCLSGCERVRNER